MNRVTREAPAAAARRYAAREGLIDTSALLRFLDTHYQMKPVFATQVATPDRANVKQKKTASRHFVVAADRSGLAIFVLNGHNKDRRTHIGIGFWDIRSHAPDYKPGYIIFHSAPIQRWRGYEGVIEGLMKHERRLRTFRRELHEFDPTRLTFSTPAVDALARRMATQGYLDSVQRTPKSSALVSPGETNLVAIAFDIIHRMLTGGLESSATGGRKIKAIHRPDGLFHAGMVLGDMLAKLLDTDLALGDWKERAVRP